MSSIKSYRDLVVWDKAVDLAVRVNQFCEAHRKPGFYVQADQLVRSGGSVPANIAEGYGRRSRGDYLRFVGIANGSLLELETHLIIARRARSDWADSVEPLLESSAEVGRMLIGLHRALRRSPLKPG